MSDARKAYQAVNDAIGRVRERQAGIVATALARVASGLPMDSHYPALFAELDAELDLLAAAREVAEEAVRAEGIAAASARAAEGPAGVSAPESPGGAPSAQERSQGIHPAEVVIEAAKRLAGRVRP